MTVVEGVVGLVAVEEGCWAGVAVGTLLDEAAVADIIFVAGSFGGQVS